MVFSKKYSEMFIRSSFFIILIGVLNERISSIFSREIFDVFKCGSSTLPSVGMIQFRVLVMLRDLMTIVPLNIMDDILHLCLLVMEPTSDFLVGTYVTIKIILYYSI